MHRPIVQANLPPAIQIGLKTDDYPDYPAKLPANHTPLADQTEVWNGLKTDDHPAKLSAKPAVNHSPLADQPKAWNGLKTDDHPAKPAANHHTPLADHTDGTEQQPTVACMKEALAQFKSMEDLTRPPPNPVLALSKQKAAIATHMKQYHDIIHVSYAIQTV